MDNLNTLETELVNAREDKITFINQYTRMHIHDFLKENDSGETPNITFYRSIWIDDQTIHEKFSQSHLVLWLFWKSFVIKRIEEEFNAYIWILEKLILLNRNIKKNKTEIKNIYETQWELVNWILLIKLFNILWYEVQEE